VLLFGCFLPFQTVLLPASFTLGKMGLASTTTGLVLVHVVYGLAFTTLFFRNYYVSIPDALVKAARLDGAVSSPSSGGSFCRCRPRSSWSA
jgi:glucose/mannose transport system permease protein